MSTTADDWRLVTDRSSLRLPPVPWRDPHTVSPAELAEYIARSWKRRCLGNPHSADLRTCLGMAHAMNFDVYKSMDALEVRGPALEPNHFCAQMKYAELSYRLRALIARRRRL